MVYDRGYLTRNCRNANLVSKNGVFGYLGNGIIHREEISDEVNFRARYGAP